jgi:hypothetical protein
VSHTIQTISITDLLGHNRQDLYVYTIELIQASPCTALS